MSWVGLQCVRVAFHDHTQLFFLNKIEEIRMYARKVVIVAVIWALLMRQMPIIHTNACNVLILNGV